MILWKKNALVFVLSSRSTALVLFTEVRPQSPLVSGLEDQLMHILQLLDKTAVALNAPGLWGTQTSLPSQNACGLPKCGKGGYINLGAPLQLGTSQQTRSIAPAWNQLGPVWGSCGWRLDTERASTKIEPKYLRCVRGTEESTKA